MKSPERKIARRCLPPGKTCADCVHHPRCVAIFNCPATNTHCDWSPSKFRDKPLSVGDLVKFKSQFRPHYPHTYVIKHVQPVGIEGGRSVTYTLECPEGYGTIICVPPFAVGLADGVNESDWLAYQACCRL